MLTHPRDLIAPCQGFFDLLARFVLTWVNHKIAQRAPKLSISTSSMLALRLGTKLWCHSSLAA